MSMTCNQRICNTIEIHRINLIVFLDSDLSLGDMTQYQYGIMCGGIVLTTALEAYTHQVDNLLLGVFLFALFIAFLW